MIVLGIGGSLHDFSACVVRDGQVVAAIEEERLSRHKYHALGRISRDDLRLLSVDYCLSTVGLTLGDVDLTVANDLVFAPMLRGLPRLTLINHHLSHAAHVFLQSPFEESAVLVMDGFGSIVDGRAETTTYFRGESKAIDRVANWEGRVVPREPDRPYSWANLGHVEDSLGEFYSYGTELLGFGMYEEGKTMGLAAHGGDRFHKPVAEIVRMDDTGGIVFRDVERRELEALAQSELRGGFDGDFAAYADLAHATQHLLEEALLRRIEDVRSVVDSSSLCLSGGIFMNCVANRRLMVEGPFERVFVHGASGDNGTALGAALWGHASVTSARATVEPVIFGGRSYSRSEMLNSLEQEAHRLRWREVDNVARAAAEEIDRGGVVAWFQGGSEFGARALGNRSILADPRRSDMQDRINSLVKGRELFRPFAPSVLWERAGEYFKMPRDSPFMCVNALVREPRRLPAVSHVDSTARVQTVRREDNPRYYDLIRAFADRPGGVAVVLNTSFNEQEPIVETPAEAVACFLRTRIDALYLGDFVVTKQ